MDDKPKRGDWSRRKGPWESPNEKIRIKRAKNLITEKDRDRAKKYKDLLNAFFKILLTHNTKSSNKQTSYQPNALQN